MKDRILNLGSGKILPLDLPEVSIKPEDGFFLVNLDSGYYPTITEAKDVSPKFVEWTYNPIQTMLYVNENAFTFMEKYPFTFDKIVIYRFLEHVARRDVLYFIYLMSTSLKKGGVIDCIVPHYKILAERILKEDPISREVNFEAEDIITTTELLNEPSCPHASIWTLERIKYFFQLEKRFVVKEWYSPFTFDDRSIYLRAIIERV